MQRRWQSTVTVTALPVRACLPERRHRGDSARALPAGARPSPLPGDAAVLHSMIHTASDAITSTKSYIHTHTIVVREYSTAVSNCSSSERGHCILHTSTCYTAAAASRAATAPGCAGASPPDTVRRNATGAGGGGGGGRGGATPPPWTPAPTCAAASTGAACAAALRSAAARSAAASAAAASAAVAKPRNTATRSASRWARTAAHVHSSPNV